MIAKTIGMQIRREFWENRVSFLWAPLLFTLLFSVISIWLIANESYVKFGDEQRVMIDGSGIESYSTFDPATGKERLDLRKPDALTLMTGVHQIAAWGFYALLFCVVIVIYAHSSLFADRKSREILFWRSMPVSETVNVFVKLAMICVVVPLIILIANLVGVSLFLLAAVIIGQDLDQLFSALKTLSVSFKILGGSFIVILLIFPFIAWNLFASALAKRSPVTISIVVPLGLWLMDVICQKYLAINLFFKDALGAYFQLAAASLKKAKGDKGASILEVNLISSVDIKITSIALAISVLLIIATIWLRNNRYEI